ncbi:MAG: phosphatase PAP2 family protein [Chitinophagaceae bacterium]|nr:MAG: phosphatase PAP2 family protein [Chitinophagaceae bacterium]
MLRVPGWHPFYVPKPMHVTSFLRRYAAKIYGSGALFLLILLLSIGSFAWILHEVIIEKDHEFDLEVFNELAPFITPSRTAFMKWVTFGASARFLQIAYGVVILLYAIGRNWIRCLEILVIGLGGFLINYFMKLSFQRLRPPNPLLEPLLNYSFPSGHANSGFIFYGLLAYLVLKMKLTWAVRIALCALLIGWAFLIGFSRIYLRMHYTSDVLAGFCNGAAWLVLCILILERLKRKASRESGQTERQAERAQ